ncbi:hypothetical protein OpiT1DRAFT_05795 [Opitutaceae bacterium TAV1]|nr:hypothetical protein OPIT5_20895 [Opitutaceae bacterium TAV5]EIQ01223.1 hypothetical protein OpiT1DRAFT_05795 [Opitutaceae bacterium TAV1]
MATHSIGSGKALLGTTVPEPVARAIITRAGALGWTKSRYAGAVLQAWYDAGCPPVGKADEAVNGYGPGTPEEGDGQGG